MKRLWQEEVNNIKLNMLKGKTLEDIGNIYGVSRQRMYQIFTKFGIQTHIKTRKNFLVGLGPEYYWLNKMLCKAKIPKSVRLELLESIELPKECPMLGQELNYLGTGEQATRSEYSPSLDRIDSTQGYVKGNLQVISWRANRIKNDATPEELDKIATYMLNLTKKSLQL